MVITLTCPTPRFVLHKLNAVKKRPAPSRKCVRKACLTAKSAKFIIAAQVSLTMCAMVKKSIGNERKLVVDAVFHLRKQYPKKKIIGYKLISKKLKWSLSKTRKRLAVYGEIPGMALKNRRKVENEPLSDEELRRYERSRSYFGY